MKISPWLLTDDRNKRASFRASVTGRLIVTGIPTPRTQFLNPEEQQQQQQQQKGTRVWGRVCAPSKLLKQKYNPKTKTQLHRVILHNNLATF
jgi:hypothetical protein